MAGTTFITESWEFSCTFIRRRNCSIVLDIGNLDINYLEEDMYCVYLKFFLI